eukprot:8219193-Prorocentrum_lima.AAC.1
MGRSARTQEGVEKWNNKQRGRTVARPTSGTEPGSGSAATDAMSSSTSGAFEELPPGGADESPG